MTKLIDALQTENTLTENGMTTNSSSLNLCVNLFFQIGALRGQGKTKVVNAFTKAYNEDALTALRILFWARDIRGGAGERQIFRDCIEFLAKKHKESARKNLALIPEYGRWDDLLALVGTPLEQDALAIIKAGLENSEVNGLCAKWMPRPNVSNMDKKKQAAALRKYLGMEPKEYRKMLVELSNTVEQAMCAKDWSNINYEHVPSKAMSDYMKAFGKNDYERFTAYLESLENGEAKINAGAVYPYDITKNVRHGNAQGADAQWKALPNFMEDNQEVLLPVVDVSGSMGCPAGNNPNVTCLDVAISLGLYISERNEGQFKDAFITFSQNPELQVLKGSLSSRVEQLRTADWAGNTDLEATFKMILNQAVKHNVPESEMPTMVLILSDMEFDQATSARWGSTSEWNPTAHNMIERMYSEKGYTMPKIVYWNLHARNENFPVRFDKKNTALVSGFSPALLKGLLAGRDLTPYSMMIDIVGSERYAPVTV